MTSPQPGSDQAFLANYDVPDLSLVQPLAAAFWLNLTNFLWALILLGFYGSDVCELC
jgi:hypothetical protein